MGRAILLIQAAAWVSAVAVALVSPSGRGWVLVAWLGVTSWGLGAWWARRQGRLRREEEWQLASRLASLDAPGGTKESEPSSGDSLVERELCRLRVAFRELRDRAAPNTPTAFALGDSVELDLRRTVENAMTRSGLYAPRGLDDSTDTGSGAGQLPPAMDNRLDPRTLCWLESSPSELAFLGWPIERLRAMSFLDILHPDDRELAREQLRAALIKGEAHGLVYRIRIASGESKAIEMFVGVRYGADRRVNHLRCHIRDVTAKVKASRELRRRTRELTLLNQQLRRTNRELQDLKDLYRDLYQNAPAMYFSLDGEGAIRDCNDTMLQTLGFRRDQLVGQPYDRLLPEWKRPLFLERFAEFLRSGHLEVESDWLKADGTEIVVWIKASALRDAAGKIVRSRSVALDVTAQRALEAALREKNALLAQANDELSRKIRELDEFGYVVSHDLQEPLRTLVAFSDFLLRDCGDRLDETGREYVKHLVEASRRMRAMIHDLLALSRAGKVTAELAPVNLDDVVAIVRSDLAELVRTRDAEFAVSLPPATTLWGDRDRLVQLVSNLVVNGLKYNRSAAPRVEIGLDAASTDDEAVVFLRDNGIGIDPKFHDRIFQLFRRLHTREEFEGTGAGLAIAQKIVQAHGGQIWVESEPGRGSTFFVRLRRRRPSSSTKPPSRVDVANER